MSKIWPWRVFKLNVSTVFSFDVGVFSERRKNKDKMKTEVDSTHISNMYDKQETHIDRDHNPVLCLLPLSSTIPSPQRNCLRPPGHPCPCRPSSTSSIWARCPREHRDDRESKWKSKHSDCWTLLFALWLNPTKGWKKRRILLLGPTKSDQPRQRCQLETKEQNSSYVNINGGLVHVTPEPEVWQKLTEVSIVANRLKPLTPWPCYGLWQRWKGQIETSHNKL